METTAEKKYTPKDFTSNQEVNGAGCDDYVILRTMQKVLPEMGVAKEDVVFVSGIGCSSRFRIVCGNLRHSQYSRQGSRNCNGRKTGQSQPKRLDFNRRRRSRWPLEAIILYTFCEEILT